MSTNLPPYSTFGRDGKQQIMFPHAKSFGNVLTFTPPGFKQALNVKFPDSRLPVCVSCKKNFKTKDMCRVRNQHSRPPWTTAYICMTLDSTCTDEDGKYVDKPFVVRMVHWRPFSVMEDFAPNSKTPVCTTCKKTNRTRSFCRDRHKHRKLPWCTVYVMLSTQESVDPSTVVAAPSTKIVAAKDAGGENNQGKTNTSPSPSVDKESTVETETDTHESPEKTSAEASTKSNGAGKTQTNTSKKCKQTPTVGGDDINDIPESRTMLIQINDEETNISWLKLLHDEDNSTKAGVWVPHALSQTQKPAIATTLIQSAPGRNYPFQPVAPVIVRKRNAETSISIETSHDGYRQHTMGGYPTATGQPLPPGTQHPYTYHHPLTTALRKGARTPSPYGAHVWPYPTAVMPSQQRQHIPHPYATAQHRPMSPAPVIGSPGGPMIGASSASASVTAGEAAAMRRKKPRRELEADENPESQTPYPSPPPPPPAPIAPQLHHAAVGYSQLPLAPIPQPPPGPPPLHQQQHHPPGPIQEHQPWMVYQQMYQAQLPPIQYANDPPRMTVRTPESASRNFHHDESPNNVTMTPGPGDGGGDHDSDDNDFNRGTLL